MKPAIRIENLSKRYCITPSELRVVPRTMREEVMRLAAMPFERLRKGFQPAGSEEFWALKDVSFDVEPGKVVGAIGRNGAGKSTLMKIISRITRPTTGSVHFRGRVGSLLEVSTGFHPELTGRENVYLSGALLGMGRREVRRKFDEIIDFSEVEKFIDTPVKRYSSGMKVRLGFAVAAHFEPEILLLDEVLSVGDVGFRKKCLDKMLAFAKGGRSILIVTHKLGALDQLCDSLVLLDQGQLICQGGVAEVLERYDKIIRLPRENREGGDPLKNAKITSLKLKQSLDVEKFVFDFRMPIRAEVTYVLNETLSQVQVVCSVSTRKGEGILVTPDVVRYPDLLENRTAGEHTAIIEIPGGILNVGEYVVGVSMQTGTPSESHLSQSVQLEIVNPAHQENDKHSFSQGVIARELEWAYTCRETLSSLSNPADGISNRVVSSSSTKSSKPAA